MIKIIKNPKSNMITRCVECGVSEDRECSNADEFVAICVGTYRITVCSRCYELLRGAIVGS